MTIVRYGVFAIFALAALVAFGSWLVRSRTISPFTAFGRGLRAMTDPVLRPVERRLVRMGGNPVNAGWWLVVIVAAGGVVFISLFGWALSTFPAAAAMASAGPLATIVLLVNIAYNVLFYAIIIRVIASWLGFFRYTRWLRPIYAMTDWLIVPVQRFVPPIGMMDISPLVALVILYFLRWILMAGFARVGGI